MTGAAVMAALAVAAARVATRHDLTLWARIGVWVWAGLCAGVATALAAGT